MADRSEVWLSFNRSGDFSSSSAAWSVSTGASLRGGVQYLFLIIGAIGVAENLEGDDFMALLAWVCFLSGVASLGLLVISPANAFGGAGDFRGVFSQKNILGQAMAVGALASLHGLWVGKRRPFYMGMFSLTSFVALKSESTTSLSAIVVFTSLGLVIRLLQQRGSTRILAIPWIVLLLPLGLVGAFNKDALLEALGKDPTLTGRSIIWENVIPDIYRRPMLGWGYGAFWSTDNPEAWQLADTFHWYSPQAHNGILEMLLGVGLIGTIFIICLWGRAVWLSLRCMRTAESAMATTCLLTCAGVVVIGVSETVLLYPEALTLIFFVTGLFCEKSLSTAQRRHAAAPRHVVSLRPRVETHASPRRPKLYNDA